MATYNQLRRVCALARLGSLLSSSANNGQSAKSTENISRPERCDALIRAAWCIPFTVANRQASCAEAGRVQPMHQGLAACPSRGSRSESARPVQRLH